MKNYAINLGGIIANPVWLGLVFAQQISDGNGSKKVWKKLCNNTDTNDWYRLIEWMDGLFRLVGGTRY